MKIKRRALALLLSMVMVLTFMPALAFAGDDEAAAEGAPAVEETKGSEEAGEPLKAAPQENMEKEAGKDAYDDNSFYPDATAELIMSGGRTLTFDYDDWTYNLSSGDKIVVHYGNKQDTLNYAGLDDEDDPIFKNSAGDATGYVFYDTDDRCLKLSAWKDDDDDQPIYGIYIDIQGTVKDVIASISFTPNTISAWGPSIQNTYTGGSYYDIYKRYRWTYPNGSYDDYPFAPGETLRVTYADGSYKEFVCKVTSNSYGYDAWFVYGEETIWPDLYSNADLVPGYNAATIGFRGVSCPVTIFIDTPELAAQREEAARQGTYVGGLPKVKIAKPAAAKKSVTVKWKKLDKKQLKKGVTNIEVWVCPNKAFGAGDTIIKFAGKKKASLKVKGLKKGTYFVKVRAIKNVGGVKQYTAWSKVKKVKVKK